MVEARSEYPMNLIRHASSLSATRKLLTAISFSCSCTLLLAQGYIYTFQGFPGYQQLDGSFFVVSNALGGTPLFSDLLDIKILDSFMGPTTFNVSVAPQDFNVTAFGPQDFTGSIIGLSGSFTGHTTVRFVGLGDSLSPGIYASDNGFFPGNPSGEAVLGNWIATPLPEPEVGALFLASLLVAGLRRLAKLKPVFKTV